jgi:tetratricopeptide (TPR) repeat protein
MGRRSSRWVPVLALLIVQGCMHEPPAQQPPVQPVVAPPTQSETRALLDSNQFAELDRRFSAVQRNYKDGSISDEDLRAAFRAFYPTDAALEQKYTAWIAQFPKSYVARLARAIYYVWVGRERRGGNVISETREEQLRGMEAAFAQASKDLDVSLHLDDKPLLTYAQEMDIVRYVSNGDSARAILQTANKIDPDNVVVREKYMGTLMTRWGGSEEEMRAFVEESRGEGLSAPRLHSLEVIILTDQAQTEEDAGDYASAERDYRKGVESGNVDCLTCFAGVLAHEGKFAEAIPIYSKSLALYPNNADTLSNRGYAYMQTGMMHEGIDDLRAAAEAGNAYAQCALGLYYMVGVPGVLSPDPTEGIAWFKKSAAQDYPAGKENLERARKLFGDQAVH